MNSTRSNCPRQHLTGRLQTRRHDCPFLLPQTQAFNGFVELLGAELSAEQDRKALRELPVAQRLFEDVLDALDIEFVRVVTLGQSEQWGHCLAGEHKMHEEGDEERRG
jgi:hypothetical protein